MALGKLKAQGWTGSGVTHLSEDSISGGPGAGERLGAPVAGPKGPRRQTLEDFLLGKQTYLPPTGNIWLHLFEVGSLGQPT